MLRFFVLQVVVGRERTRQVPAMRRTEWGTHSLASLSPKEIELTTEQRPKQAGVQPDNFSEKEQIGLDARPIAARSLWHPLVRKADK